MTSGRSPSTCACSSCRNSCIRGPSMKCCAPAPSMPSSATPSGRDPSAATVLGDHVDDVHPEAVDAAVEPPAQHLVDRLAHRRVLPVEVRLLAGEQVQVVVAARLVQLPGRPGEERRPVGRLGAGQRPAAIPARGGRHQYQSRLGSSWLRAAGREPRVLVRGVVDDDVDDDLDPALVGAGHERVEVGQRAEDRVDVLVVADVVAVVVLRRGVERREPDRVDPQLGQVVEPGDHARQVPDAVAVRVGEAARVDLVDRRRTATSVRRCRRSPRYPTSR